ncbi:hypothetical protein GFS31_41730 (plasmid) [Leptolyngbya sp. BL0902]|uniref:hypothetical protein n=1 Tax=Leptolyngbya sp. BL0902 TaxID=1115757 RepID=UPI0018E850FD|nr:hypothetical protein [Leptolyngbya sp. BL0902]QQE67460.1 hypothetical protein GFS31_41730 [Leptolyngbya sp. BL0902]
MPIPQFPIGATCTVQTGYGPHTGAITSFRWDSESGTWYYRLSGLASLEFAEHRLAKN